MSAPALFDPSSALAAIVSSPHRFSPEALIKAVKRDQRRVEANAWAARQIGAKSADQLWSDARAKATGKASAASEGASPSTANLSDATSIDELWRDAATKQTCLSAVRGVYR